VGALVEINCETDFVTKNDSFLAFTKAVVEGIVKNNPADVEAVGAMPLTLDGFGPTVEDVRKGLIGKIGENMSVRRFKRFATGSKLASYLHGTRIGVVVEFEGDEAAAKDVAMHVAAMKPVSLSSAEVPAELVAKERSWLPPRPPKMPPRPRPKASPCSPPKLLQSVSKAACRST
jgi:elongation factor Ts